MSTLILNAGTSAPIAVTCQRAGKAPPRMVGNKSYSDNGRERTSIRGQAKVIPILASYLTTAQEAAIQAAVSNGVQIPCSGDILGNIQTLCSIDNVVSNMVPGLVDFWEMSFTLSEVNASVVLLRYAPGDTITGETFTRTITGRQKSANGDFASAAINAKRDNHFQTTFGTRSTLLEDARPNLVVQSDAITAGTGWTMNGTTGTAAFATKGILSLTRITTATAGATQRAVTLTGNGPKAWSCVVQFDGVAGTTFPTLRDITAGTTRGQVQVTFAADGTATANNVTGTLLAFESLGDNAYRIVAQSTSCTAANAHEIWATNPGTIASVRVGGVQVEDALYPSSIIPTTTATLLKTADFYSLPLKAPPSEMTAYAKFISLGIIPNAAVFYLTSAGVANPTLAIYNSAGFYAAFHNNGTTAVQSTLAAAPAYGDTVELVLRLFADGSVDITQSLTGATATAGAQTVANALATAWAAQLVWLNSAGTLASFNGFAAFQSFKIVAGARSLAEMRAA